MAGYRAACSTTGSVLRRIAPIDASTPKVEDRVSPRLLARGDARPDQQAVEVDYAECLFWSDELPWSASPKSTIAAIAIGVGWLLRPAFASSFITRPARRGGCDVSSGPRVDHTLSADQGRGTQ